MSITAEAVRAALSQVTDPNTGKDLVSSKAVKNIQVEGSDVSFDVELGYPAKSQVDGLRKAAIAAVRTVPGAGNVSVNVQSKIVAHSVQRGVKLMSNVKNIIAVASGKGGVGKSTTAVNLALALAAEGAQVGILDADIYGPSQPMMMGISGRPESVDGKTMEPMENYGLQVSSIGFMINADEPMVWRGPIVTQALQQLLDQTNWRDLDYLIIDMPPGTGDIALTLSQMLPLAGAVVVCTPQDVALLDAVKAIAMFRKVNIPLLGMVENMSGFVCPDCGKRYDIFGSGGAQQRARELSVPFLGEVPINIQIRANGDAGRVGASFDDPACAPYLQRICTEMVKHLGPAGQTVQPPLPSL